jgi:hypothetical protein
VPADHGGAFCATCGTALAASPEEPSLPAVVRRDKVVVAVDGHGVAAAKDALTFASPAPPPPPAPMTVPTQPASWQQSLPAPFNTIPVELVAVCGLMAVAGLLVLWPALKVMPSLFQVLGQGGLAFLLLSVWLLLAGFGAALLLLAWRLAHGDRVARGLTYVLCGALGGSLLLGDQQQGSLTLVVLACAGIVAVLAGSPRVKQFFTGGAAPQGDQPVPITVARTLVAVWACCVAFGGLAMLPLAGAGAKYFLIGAIFIVLAIAAFRLSRRLAEGDATTRKIVTGGAGAYLFLLLILGRRDPGMLVPLGLVAGTVWNLWVPPEAQRHFEPSAG